MILKKVVLWIRRLLITMISIFIVIYGLSYIMEKPDLGQGHYINIYDQDHRLYYQSQKQGQNVKLNEVSQDFLVSIVAIEDHRFYSHRGFDPIGIMRAIVRNLQDGSASEGASTITQQYARLLFLTNEKTWSRKIKEAFLTTRLEAHYSKDTILEGYINTVYFGHGVYGIHQASHYYFDKDPKDLDLNEATMLAGVINGPSYFSPFLDKEGAKKRQKVVLNRLVEENYITQEKADQIAKTPFQLNKDPASSIAMSHPYFKDTVIAELQDIGLYEEKYINQGLNIETTLNEDIQTELENIIQKEMKDKDELEVASMIVDSHTGSVLALIGGKDYTQSEFNRATSSSRQVGSTIKPLLYYLALENGFSPNTKFKSEATTFQLDNGQTYSPANYNHKYAQGDITLAQAIAVSDNIYAVKTHMFLGEQTLVNALNRFGFKHISPHPSLALGTLNTNIYQMASIYTTFANEGVYNNIHTIQRVTTDSGKVLYEYQPQNEQMLNQDTCLILNQLLTAPFQDIYSTYASATMASAPTNATFAAKSGTSSYDSLCMGYNPNYTILSWVGYDDNRELTLATDRRISKNIFQTVANFLQKEDVWYQPTDHLQLIPINPITGDYYEQGLVYWFKNT